MKPPRTRPSLLFRLIIPACAIFVLTILSTIATLFSNPEAPVVQWLNRYGNALLLVEFVVLVVLIIAAMAVDRSRIKRGIDEEPIREES